MIGDLETVKDDLNEAMSLAERGGMDLLQVDCHLEYARLFLAMGEKSKVKSSLDSAKSMMEKMGYHLRERDVKEIEGQL